MVAEFGALYIYLILSSTQVKSSRRPAPKSILGIIIINMASVSLKSEIKKSLFSTSSAPFAF